MALIRETRPKQARKHTVFPTYKFRRYDYCHQRYKSKLHRAYGYGDKHKKQDNGAKQRVYCN